MDLFFVNRIRLDRNRIDYKIESIRFSDTRIFYLVFYHLPVLFILRNSAVSYILEDGRFKYRRTRPLQVITPF